MAQIDPRLLLQAAMAQGGDSGAGAGVDPGMAGGIPGTTPGALPSASPAAAPTGGPQGGGVDPTTGGLSNADLSSMVGTGTQMQQEPDAMQSMIAMLNDPSTPPDQKMQIQKMLQLAALQSIAGGPNGAVGSSS